MHALSTAKLLDAWERGLHQSPPERAMTLLTVYASHAADDLAQLTIGERDRRLLLLRRQLFGRQMICRSVCPACGEQLEMMLDAAELGGEPGERQAGLNADAPGETDADLMFDKDGYLVHFRLPNSRDLAAITRCAGVAEARAMLLRRCLSAIEHDGEQSSAEHLPEEVIVRIVERMAQSDPQADIELALRCAGCNYQWEEVFDINTFLWSEVEAWARRLLTEVHTLARAYGWIEGEILSMSQQRRHLYLEMVRG